MILGPEAFLYMKFSLLDLFYFQFIVIIYQRDDFEFKHGIFVPLWITLHKQQSFIEIIVSIVKQSFRSELESNTTINKILTNNNSVETQIIFIIAAIFYFVGVIGNSATFVLFLVQKKYTNTNLIYSAIFLLFSRRPDGSHF